MFGKGKVVSSSRTKEHGGGYFHVTAVVEYVIHCVYTARHSEITASSAFMNQLNGIRHRTTDTGTGLGYWSSSTGMFDKVKYMAV